MQYIIIPVRNDESVPFFIEELEDLGLEHRLATDAEVAVIAEFDDRQVVDPPYRQLQLAIEQQRAMELARQSAERAIGKWAATHQMGSNR